MFADSGMRVDDDNASRVRMVTLGCVGSRGVEHEPEGAEGAFRTVATLFLSLLGFLSICV